MSCHERKFSANIILHIVNHCFCSLNYNEFAETIFAIFIFLRVNEVRTEAPRSIEEKKNRKSARVMHETQVNRKSHGEGWNGSTAIGVPDKISNLKFHRNFTILGSKLIALSGSSPFENCQYSRAACATKP